MPADATRAPDTERGDPVGARNAVRRAIDYQAGERLDGRGRRRMHRAWTADYDRREAARCALLGHVPRVGNAGSRHRWVECGRCLARPENTSRQFYFTSDTPPGEVRLLLDVARDAEWTPRRARLRAELIVGPYDAGTVALRVQGPGTPEYALQLAAAVPGLGAVYLCADGFLARMVDRLPLGADREVGLHLHGGTVHWNAWHPASDWTPTRWRAGSWRPATTFLGQPTIEEEVLAADVPCAVPMPEGTYGAVASLTRVTRARSRGRTRVTLEAMVTCPDGIPVPGNPDSDFYDGDEFVHGAGAVVDAFDDDGEWVAVAAGRLVTSALRLRARYATPSWSPAAPS